jgi:hypothetical protein
MPRSEIHLLLHVLIPALVAYFFFPKARFKSFVILMLTMLIDLDHLLADPIYDSQRCSIGFHPLHSYLAVLVYSGMIFMKKTRLVAIGLLIHVALDLIDCVWMKWQV